MARIIRPLKVATLLVIAVAAVPAAASAAPVAHALYHMDEAPGATRMVDASGFGNTATLTTTGITLGAPGLVGTAYSFTGKGGRATVSSSTLNPGSATVALTAH